MERPNDAPGQGGRLGHPLRAFGCVDGVAAASAGLAWLVVERAAAAAGFTDGARALVILRVGGASQEPRGIGHEDQGQAKHAGHDGHADAWRAAVGRGGQEDGEDEEQEAPEEAAPVHGRADGCGRLSVRVAAIRRKPGLDSIFHPKRSNT